MIAVTPVAPNNDILPFAVELRAGQPAFEQLAYSVRRAVIGGMLTPGSRFPSVRTMSREFRLHPNTVQKAVTVLVQEGLLQVHPGIGTVVARPEPAPSRESQNAIRADMERLIILAKKSGVDLNDLTRLLREQWAELSA